MILWVPSTVARVLCHIMFWRTYVDYNDRINTCRQSGLDILEQKEVYVLLTKSVSFCKPPAELTAEVNFLIKWWIPHPCLTSVTVNNAMLLVRCFLIFFIFKLHKCAILLSFHVLNLNKVYFMENKNREPQ